MTPPPTDAYGDTPPEGRSNDGLLAILLGIGATWFVISVVEGRAADRARRRGRAYVWKVGDTYPYPHNDGAHGPGFDS